QVFITVKDIPAAKELLGNYGFDFIELGSKKDSLFMKGVSQLKYNWRILNLIKKNNIDIGIGTSLTLAHVSKLSKLKSIILDDDDDDVQPLMTKYGHPFADYVLSPDVLEGKRKKKDTLYYPGYHELAYLHPNHFKPDPDVLKEIGMNVGENYFILRFNAFKAHHDVGVEGLSLENKRKLINLLKKEGEIFITTEKEIDSEFKKYQLKVSPEKIHSLMYYATMLIGDSQTMTSEAAVLGTPAIRSNSFVGKISYLEEEEQKYALTYGFKPDQFEEMIIKIEELLAQQDLNGVWAKKRDRMLSDKIDVTSFLVWFVEEFPESVKIMKNNPQYLKRFK
ncbi:MAG: DUF354 domain-containing protein, partial [Candidatus Aminicenantes bacterium]|nr:DUF354 domain-containing protein [Candidatus Aminicenantes bacterium]